MNYVTRYGYIMVPLVPALSMLIYISSCAVKPASDLDSPEYHHKAGMRHVEMGQYTEALTSFNRATDLPKTFAPAYAGMRIAHANLKNRKDAKKFAGKAQGLAGKDPDVLTLCARVWIDVPILKRVLLVKIGTVSGPSHPRNSHCEPGHP